MGRTYLPGRVVDKLVFFEGFAAELAAVGAGLGFTPGEIAAVAAAAGAARAAVDQRVAAAALLRAAQERQDAAVDGAVAACRAAVVRLQAAPQMTDALRERLRLTVPKPGRTPAPAPRSAPVAVTSFAGRLAHRVAWVDPERPGVRRLPAGVGGVEVWVTLWPAGGGAEPERRFLGTLRKHQTVVRWPADDAGRRAEYALRFVSTRGAAGPLGPASSLTIAG